VTIHPPPPGLTPLQLKGWEDEDAAIQERCPNGEPELTSAQRARIRAVLVPALAVAEERAAARAAAIWEAGVRRGEELLASDPFTPEDEVRLALLMQPPTPLPTPARKT
jgi:hypothetical protein